MNQGTKIVQFLSGGREASSAELRSRFGIANPRAAVDAVRGDIQGDGMNIYSNVRINSKGVTVAKYRIGTTTNAVHFGRSALGWFKSETYKDFVRAGIV